MKPKEWSELRKSILKRDNNNCVVCGSYEDLHIHHLKPRILGGNNNPENLLTLCSGCHRTFEPVIDEIYEKKEMNNTGKIDPNGLIFYSRVRKNNGSFFVHIPSRLAKAFQLEESEIFSFTIKSFRNDSNKTLKEIESEAESTIVIDLMTDIFKNLSKEEQERFLLKTKKIRPDYF